jgi:hypothetical protein
MNHSVNSKKNTSRLARQQRKLDAGIVSAQFPGVTGIVINMIYDQKGILKSLPRVVNFFPGSSALFRIDCLNKECIDGGFDLTRVISGMIRNRREAAKGNLSCEGNSPHADHSTITYEVSVKYR